MDFAMPANQLPHATALFGNAIQDTFQATQQFMAILQKARNMLPKAPSSLQDPRREIPPLPNLKLSTQPSFVR